MKPERIETIARTIAQTIAKFTMALSLVFTALTAFAQGYPTKPVRIVTSSAVGTPGDIMLRFLAPKLGAALGQPVVVDARPGAGGVIAATEVVRGASDGHTILFSSNQLVAAKLLGAKQAIDVEKDLLPINYPADALSFVLVHASLPVNNLRELVDYLKRNPGKVSFSTSGNGSALHFTGEAFKLATGTDMLHVAYSGATQGTRLNDVFSGLHKLDWSSVPSFRGQMGTGKIKLLAVLDRTRFPVYPDVPAITEFYPDYQFSSSYWLFFGPRELPQPIVSRLDTEITRGLKDPEIAKKLEDIGVKLVGAGAKEAQELYQRDFEFTARLAKLAGLKPQQ